MLVVAVAVLTPAPLVSQSPPAGPGLDPQPSAASDVRGCGTELTPEEAQRYLELLAQGGPETSPVMAPPPYCVPIAGHIVRASNGTGGMTLSQYFQSIDDANFYFQNSGIQFYSLGVDYIDDDIFYGETAGGEIDMLRSMNVVPAAINVYYTPNLTGLCGISSFTFSAVQGIVMDNDCSGVPSNRSTMPHEIGHYFNLYHTHETAFGVEYVDGSNCGSAGDLLCDTPADPLLSGFVTSYPGCMYTGGFTDPNGDTYVPDTHQIMSYSLPLCADVFSPQSETRAVSVLTNARPELLSRGCTPVSPPTLSGVTPPNGFADQTKDVVLVGTNLAIYTYVNFGDGVTVNTTEEITPDSLLVSVSIEVGATPGFRDVIVNNAFDPDTLSGVFEVKGTPIHYVSPAGLNIYPYGSPAEAATALGGAMTAAGHGDTVKVDTTAVVGSFIVDRNVIMSGGWADDFATRDFSGKKTHLSLSGNLSFVAPGTCGIEGFLLTDGLGSFDGTPETGNYGGAIRAVNTTVVIRNCEITACDANNSTGFGGGGGIYAGGSNVTIEDCYLHGNEATRGGGIYIYDCSGTVADVVIENNLISLGGSAVVSGGAIAIHSSASISLSKVSMSGNTGAAEGGALWCLGSTVSMTGGDITGHGASSSGGAIHADNSTVTLTGVTLDSNASSLFGGAITAQNGGSLSISLSDITGNSGILGGIIYATATSTTLLNNLVTGNTGTNSGVYITGAGGSIHHNTLHGNNAGAGSALFFQTTTSDVRNNIVSGTTGNGVGCSGGGALFEYNLVYNSSASDYSGCVAGTGSLGADPLYANAVGGDFHLAIHSPGIDAGDPASSDPDGGRTDMGRYAGTGWGDQPARPAGAAANPAGANVELYWDPSPEPDVSYYAVYCDTLSGFVPGAGNLFTTTTDTLLSVTTPTDTTWYLVNAVDASGYAGGYSVEITSLPDPASNVVDPRAMAFTLDQNVPNPFNPTTTIRFSLATPEHVTLNIYDVAGRRVRTLVNTSQSAGPHAVTWNGINDRGATVSSGIYFYRLQAGSFAETHKMVLLK